MNLAVLPVIASTFLIGATTLDGTTSVPLGAVLGSAATVFLVGMWVSRKVTRFEEMCLRFSEQQVVNMSRLDSMDKRLCVLDDRLSHFERNKGRS